MVTFYCSETSYEIQNIGILCFKICIWWLEICTDRYFEFLNHFLKCFHAIWNSIFLIIFHMNFINIERSICLLCLFSLTVFTYDNNNSKHHYYGGLSTLSPLSSISIMASPLFACFLPLSSFLSSSALLFSLLSPLHPELCSFYIFN